MDGPLLIWNRPRGPSPAANPTRARKGKIRRAADWNRVLLGLSPGGVCPASAHFDVRRCSSTRERLSEPSGELLPHRFTRSRHIRPSVRDVRPLTRFSFIRKCRGVCFLWHFPESSPRGEDRLPLGATVPCGVRTFLSRLSPDRYDPACGSNGLSALTIVIIREKGHLCPAIRSESEQISTFTAPAAVADFSRCRVCSNRADEGAPISEDAVQYSISLKNSLKMEFPTTFRADRTLRMRITRGVILE